jgi:MYXO-CTERM domain-containing protein
MNAIVPGKKTAALLLMAITAGFASARAARAATYYVAPTGSDMAAGSEAAPWKSMAKAQTMAAAGDTILFRAGTYVYTAGTTACSSQTANISGVLLTKAGTAGNLIKYWAYPGEVPILDFDGIRDSCRIRGITVQTNYVHLKGFELKGVRQNNNLNHESWGVWVSGSNNVFENLNIHHIMGAGLFIQKGGNNLVLNCDSHDNLDEMTSNGAGESADGFGCHVSAGESGNVFRGCRAWWNADDGYDFINAFDACTVEYSWAWYNGYRPGTMTGIGNGNGFKSGGYGADPADFPAAPARHTTRFCLAVANKAAGFYANHHPNSCYFYNNTGYGNNPNFNMLGMNSSGGDITVGVYRNNIAFSGTLFSNRNGADETYNSWTVSGVTVNASDFQNTSVTGLDAPRKPDGSLPDIPNFHLASGSDLIDKGTNVMLPFAGSAPDLGAFETGLAVPGSGGAGGTATGGAGATGGRAGAGGAATGGSAGGRGGMTVTGSGGTTSGGAPGSGGAGASGTGGAATGGAGTGGAVTSSGGTGTSTGGGPATGGAGSGGGSGGAGPGDPGCGCAMPGGGRSIPGAAAVALVLALALARRRRRP